MHGLEPCTCLACQTMNQAPGAWWVLPETTIRAMLQRVKDGEDPDTVLIEEYVNCDHERPE